MKHLIDNMHFLEQYKTFIFDFDGTLVDSMPYFSKTVYSALDSYGAKYPDNVIEISTPLGYVGTAEYMISELGVKASVEDIVSLMHGVAYEYYRDLVPLKDGVFEFLSKMKRNGCCLNILTASPHKVLDVCLKRLGVYEMFDRVDSCEDYATTKSDVRIYSMMAEKLGKDVSEIAFFDDNIVSVSTAKKSGMFAVGVYDKSGESFKNKLKAMADAYVNSFDELIFSDKN